MRVVMTMKWEGVTPDQYDQLRKSVDMENNKPNGLLFHISGFDNNTLRVTDVWESAEKFNDFVQSHLMPHTQKLGIPGKPEVEIYTLHAIYPASTQLA